MCLVLPRTIQECDLDLHGDLQGQINFSKMDNDVVCYDHMLQSSDELYYCASSWFKKTEIKVNFTKEAFSL